MGLAAMMVFRKFFKYLLLNYFYDCLLDPYDEPVLEFCVP